MNRWQNAWFKNLHANSKLLYIHICDTCNKDCWYDVSMKILRDALKPLSDTEIKVAFKEVSSMCEITPDKKRLRLIACNEELKLPFASDELKPKRKKFIKPTQAEVNLIIKDEKLTKKFINHYEANGWKVGRASMVDWQATARNWVIENEDKISSTKKVGNEAILKF